MLHDAARARGAGEHALELIGAQVPMPEIVNARDALVCVLKPHGGSRIVGEHCQGRLVAPHIKIAERFGPVARKQCFELAEMKLQRL